MCIIMFADQPVRVPMLLESFHPITTTAPAGRALFEQAYDVLINNVSGQEVTRLVFGHPRNVVRGPTSARRTAINLLQHHDWLGERYFPTKPRTPKKGKVTFDLWFPGRSPHTFKDVTHFLPKTSDVSLYKAMTDLVYSPLPFVDLLNKGLPNFFEVKLPNAIKPSELFLVSLSFPGHHVTPLVEYPGPGSQHEDSFALVCPAAVWDRFEEIIARHVSDSTSNPLHDVAKEVAEKVRKPLSELWRATIDELRLGVLSDHQHRVYESREHGEITFWQMRKLRDDVQEKGVMSAHCWYGRDYVERKHFEVYFSVRAS